MAKKETMIKCTNCGNIFPFEAAQNGEIHCPCNNVFPVDDGEIVEVDAHQDGKMENILILSAPLSNDMVEQFRKNLYNGPTNSRALLLSIKIYLVVLFNTAFLYSLSVDYQLHGEIKIY